MAEICNLKTHLAGSPCLSGSKGEGEALGMQTSAVFTSQNLWTWEVAIETKNSSDDLTRENFLDWNLRNP